MAAKKSRGRPRGDYTQADRVIRIYDRLQRGEALRPRAAAESLGVNVRTFQRDINVLRSRLPPGAIVQDVCEDGVRYSLASRARGWQVEPGQVLAVLLGAQLARFLSDRAARLLGALFSGEIRRVVDVKLEHAPAPAQRYLADGTSFDAFIDYERNDGTRAFLAIETKLTDRFSPHAYDRPTYRSTMARARHVWREGSDVDARVADVPHNQLWRNHLLAIALRDHPESPYAACTSVVVRHPLDTDGAEAVAGYRSLLRDVDPPFVGYRAPARDTQPTFLELTLDAVIDAFESAAASPEERAWLSAFRERYLALERSEHLRAPT